MGHITVVPKYHLPVVMHIVAQHIEKTGIHGYMFGEKVITQYIQKIDVCYFRTFSIQT
jgi:hypothetical protein